VRHYATNITPVETYPDGAVKVRFDCSKSCGMTGDETVGKDLATAKQIAREICQRHSSSFEARVTSAIGGRR
jgi:hypothetical protein